MSQKLKQLFRTLLERFRFWLHPHQALPVAAPPVVEAGTLHRIPRPNQRANPIMQAFGEIFAPRHAAEEHILFKSIQTNGTVIEKSEEWFREGNSLKTISKHVQVVTCSGEVVAPVKINVKCSTCGGFDSSFARCSHPQCGVALCKVCQRIFAGPSGPVIYCKRHFHDAVETFNTWSALDRAKDQLRLRP